MPNRKRTSNESDKPDFQTFVDKLENMILTGAFKPRERLVEANLSQMFNVSRYWVRDAFKILETKELVMVTPFKGVVVSELSEQEVEEIFVIRVALEQLAIKLTLKNITPEDIKTLRELTETIDAMRTKFNIPAMVELDTQFHDYIFQLSQNQSLRKMINDLRKRCHIIRYSAWSSPDILDKITEEHKQFVDFLEQGASEKLLRLAEQHISHAKNYYILQLKTESALQL